MIRAIVGLVFLSILLSGCTYKKFSLYLNPDLSTANYPNLILNDPITYRLTMQSLNKQDEVIGYRKFLKANRLDLQDLGNYDESGAILFDTVVVDRVYSNVVKALGDAGLELSNAPQLNINILLQDLEIFSHFTNTFYSVGVVLEIKGKKGTYNTSVNLVKNTKIPYWMYSQSDAEEQIQDDVTRLIADALYQVFSNPKTIEMVTQSGN